MKIVKESFDPGDSWLAQPTLVEFLRARMAEDEAGARRTSAYLSPEMNTARVLVECEAKRQIVNHYEQVQNRVAVEPSPYFQGMFVALDQTVCSLATTYADHPDYDEAWRP